MAYFEIYKKNTDAIATNRGFYYQYLKTVKLWLDNYINDIDNEIYCEYEDDIFEKNSVDSTYRFHQIKCYSTDSGLNNDNVKSSLLNFYMLYEKYDYRGEFVFESNTGFLKNAGELLAQWYKQQQNGNFGVDEYIDETKSIIKKLIEDKLKKYLANLKRTDDEKDKAKKTANEFYQKLKEHSFREFLESIRWKFSEELDTDRVIDLLLAEILETIVSYRLAYDNRVDKRLLLGHLVNTVIEKSTKDNISKRMLDNKLLKEILELTEIDDTQFDKKLKELLNSLAEKNLTIKSSTNDKKFVGREDELKIIDERLKSSDSLLVVNGIGGIGKSSLVNHYLYTREDKYAYYGFIEGFGSFITEFENSLDLNSTKENELYREIIHKLRQRKGKKLLVIDNVEDIKENEKLIEMILSLVKYEYKILFTSREEIEDIESYLLDVLSLENAKKLFNSIYKVEDELLLEEILNYLDCHTLFVKMTAKTLNSKKTLTPQSIKNKFENGEFATIKRKRKESFNDYLNDLFSFEELDNDEILMLKQLSVLPSIDIKFEFLQEIFDKENDEDFEDILNYLCEKGWLIENEGSYKLHQIIKEFVLANYTPCFEEIEIILDIILKFIEDSTNIQVAINNKDYIVYFNNLVEVFDRLKIENEKVGIFFLFFANITRSLDMYNKSESIYHKSLKIHKNISEESFYVASSYNNLATLYYSMGVYEKAEPFYLKALNIWKKILGEEHPNIADLYNNLASLYDMKISYEKAIPFHFKALKIKEKVFGEEHTNTADFYNNLALLCQSIGDYEKAELLLIKALKIREKVLGLEHPITAGSYNNLAEYYRFIESYNKAKSFYIKALSIYQQVFGEEHSNTANVYNNLGLLYKSIGINNEVEYFYIKALNIYKKILGEEHFHTGNSYNNLGAFYYAQKDFEKADKYMKRAVNIWGKTLPENHPNLIGAKTWLIMIEKEILKRTPIKSEKQPKRNDPCPCNSGKKYKKCCGK